MFGYPLHQGQAWPRLRPGGRPPSVRGSVPNRTPQVTPVFRGPRGQPLPLVSKMAGEGVIFSDGVEPDFRAFNAGGTQ